MAAAHVGDDYYGEDPAVNRLEAYCRDLFGKEDALFVSSGMMANQLAVTSQVERGAEFITEYGYHIHLFESAQYAAFANVVLNPWHTPDGILKPADIEQAVHSKPREKLYAQPQLVSIENTINSRQGKVFPFSVIQELRAFTAEHGLRLHLDGARIFNAHVATGIPLADYAGQVDTISACFSKGLGAPFGSILLGPRETIERARRLRVHLGGGLHQSGIMAEAAFLALNTQLDSLAEDHRRTALLAQRLAQHGDLGVRLEEIETNTIFLDFSDRRWKVEDFERRCYERGLRLFAFPAQRVRLMVSRGVDDTQVLRAAEIISAVSKELDAAKERANDAVGAIL